VSVQSVNSATRPSTGCADNSTVQVSHLAATISFELLIQFFPAALPGLSLVGFKLMQHFTIQQLLTPLCVGRKRSSSGGGHSSRQKLDISGLTSEQIETALIPIREELRHWGYCPRTLQLIRAKPLTLVLHTSQPVAVRTTAHDADVFEDAVELPSLKAEDAVHRQLDVDGYLELVEHKTGYNGVTLVGINRHPSRSVTFRTDCTGSVNCASHSGNLTTLVTIPALNAKILHYLLPFSDDDVSGESASLSWSYCYEASYRWE
jgi:hypothetical protein